MPPSRSVARFAGAALMPRPRLTLGRLMAWIAFAAVNLAVLGTLFRGAHPSRLASGIANVLVLLVPIDLLAYAAYRRTRALHVTLDDPAREEPAALVTSLGCLIYILFLMLIMIGLLGSVIHGYVR
jgi:uncharacterized membrane protein YidH (DUF202 family)